MPTFWPLALLSPILFQGPSFLTLAYVGMPFLPFQVRRRPEARLSILIAGGMARGRASARRCWFSADVFDLVFGWHCFKSNVCMNERFVGSGGALCRRGCNVGLSR